MTVKDSESESPNVKSKNTSVFCKMDEKNPKARIQSEEKRDSFDLKAIEILQMSPIQKKEKNSPLNNIQILTKSLKFMETERKSQIN